MPLLGPSDSFPQLTLNVLGGQTLTVPDALAGGFATVLFYRGSWCPYCNAQLRAFQRARDALADTGIRVVALSVDSELTGAFVNPEPAYLQSTGFVLDPAGKVVVSVYSSGAIGRLVPDDVIGLVRYLREHAPEPA
jgi:alkyl hydroperoxide reductase subunit AhpC